MNLITTSRALVELVDQELSQADLVAHALAGSQLLQGDQQQLYQLMTRALRPFGYFLILSKAGDLRELMDTRVPIGNPLQSLPPQWVFKGGDQPEVMPIANDAEGHWAAAVQLADPTGTYVITIRIPVERFQRILIRQKMPPEWSPVILDQDWTIVGRGANPAKYVGRTGANRQMLDAPGPDRLYEGSVLEGYVGFDARSRSAAYGWTAAIAVPMSLLYKQFLGPAAVTAFAGFFVSLLAVGAIALFSVGLLRDVRALSEETGLLASGELSTAPRLFIRELQAVADGMRDANLKLTAEEGLRKLAVNELAHRLRNKIATIRALVTFQLRDQPELRDKIARRLETLAATDQLIMDAQGRGANLREIIRTELEPYEASRTTSDGPDVFLEPKLALTMALVFHELATNAAKYGALSNATGRVLVSWSVMDDRVRLEWREKDGPTVGEPSREGFGTKLINSALRSFSGAAEAEFQSAGLVVSLGVPLHGPEVTAST